MRVLMISLDRGLFGAGTSGDVVERHKKYADLAGALDVIVFSPPGIDDKVLSANLRVFPTQSSKLSHFPRALAMAKKLHSENAYDLLVTQDFASPTGLDIKQNLNIPWIVNIHSMFFSWQWLKFNLVKWYLYFQIKRAIKKADGFRVNNDDIRQKLIRLGIGKPILIQPTPINVQKFFFQSKPANEVPRIVYVGRLSPEKNVAMLVQAAKQLKGQFELFIVGNGSEEKHLKQLALSDPRIRFLGAKTHDELPAVYQMADIFVLPSNTESFGKVLIEAGAGGCALVATRTAGARSILGDGQSGVLIPVNSQKSLEAALAGLLTKRYEREYWAKRAVEMARKYDAATATKNTINFWKEIAKA